MNCGCEYLGGEISEVAVCYGVYPVHNPAHPKNCRAFAQDVLRIHGLKADLVILTEGPSTKNPNANNRIELLYLSG